MDDERGPLFFAFEFTELSADYVKSEPDSGGWWSIGYDEDAQVFHAVPMPCRALQNPPVYRIDHETQRDLGAPQSLSDFLRQLESRAMLPQAQFFADDVRFQDERFANLIRCKLHKTEGKINAADLAKPYQLKLSMMAVELTALKRELEDEPAVEMEEMPPCDVRLDDLHYFTKLAVLNLSNNEYLADIHALAQLKNLRQLSLAGTAVTDLSSLSGLPLKSLDISRCKANFSVLPTLPELRDVTAISANFDAAQQAVLIQLRDRGVNVHHG